MPFILLILLILLILYLSLCVTLYFYQEKLIFAPKKLASDYDLNFTQPYQELSIKTIDGISLSAVLFTTQQPSKGVVFYLHGKAGFIADANKLADLYLDHHYDLFVLDYRSYGKSEGIITNEQQLYDDVQSAYTFIQQKYAEKNIIVVGYSLGCAFASQIAAMNHPKQLILIAPFYNLKTIKNKRFPFLPSFLLRYFFPINQFIQACNMPITIFHGDADKTISCQASQDLIASMKADAKLIILARQGHNKIYNNKEYQQVMIGILQE